MREMEDDAMCEMDKEAYIREREAMKAIEDEALGNVEVLELLQPPESIMESAWAPPQPKRHPKYKYIDFKNSFLQGIHTYPIAFERIQHVTIARVAFVGPDGKTWPISGASARHPGDEEDARIGRICALWNALEAYTRKVETWAERRNKQRRQNRA